MTTTDAEDPIAHAARHKFLHELLDELVADFTRHNPDRRPSGTTVLELLQWSVEQSRNPTPTSGSSIG